MKTARRLNVARKMSGKDALRTKSRCERFSIDTAVHESSQYRHGSEIDEIISYIARHNPRAAADVAAAIEKTIASAARRPASAPVVYADDVRAKMVGRYQYRVFYAVRGDELLVRNVRSTRRRRP